MNNNSVRPSTAGKTTSSATNSVNQEVLDDTQKRRLRAVRRGYRAEKAEIKDNGWTVEVTFMDGSKASVSLTCSL